MNREELAKAGLVGSIGLLGVILFFALLAVIFGRPPF